MKIIKIFVCMMLTISLCLCSSVSTFALEGIFTDDLLDPSLILDGAENVTINEDGTWTAIGDFTLAFPLSYDYRMEGVTLGFDAKAESGKFDFELDLQTGPDTITPVTIGQIFGLGSQGFQNGSLAFDLRSAYRQKQKAGLWESEWYRVACTTITFRAKTATKTTIYQLRIEPIVGGVKAGDVNSDGSTDTTDARDLLFALLGEESGELRFIDIDQNREFTTGDVRELLGMIIDSV